MTNLPTVGTYLPVPTTFEEAYRIAKVLAASDLVPKDYRDKPENCLVAMQWGADVGLPGLQALQNIAVINGRPSIWGDAAKALVLNASDCEDIQEHIEGEGDEMVAVCIVKRKGRKPVEQRFTVSDAKKANLWGKAGPWQNYPKRMLQMRARGFAMRDSFPDALRGLSIAEEAQDTPNEINITPVKEISMPKPKVEPKEAKAEPKVEPKVEPKAKKAEPVKAVESEVIDGETGEIIPPTKPEPAKAKVVQTAAGQASVGMLTYIRKKAAEKDIPLEVVCAEHDIETLDGITETQGNAIVTWIRGQ